MTPSSPVGRSGNPLPGRHVVLVGLMGTGKTTVGRELASLLARPLVDNDDQVREAAGMTVAQISERLGVAEMRRVESEALERALASPTPAVVTAAAGVILDERARRRLHDAFVVWLRAAPETLAARVARGPARPLVGDDPLAVLQEMAQQRHHLYAGVADLVVDVDRLPAANLASAAAAGLAGHEKPLGPEGAQRFPPA